MEGTNEPYQEPQQPPQTEQPYQQPPPQQPYQQPPPQQPSQQGYQQPLSPEAESLKNLVNIAGIIALIFAILSLVGAIFTFGTTVIFAIVNFLIWYFCKDINKLIDQRRYGEAKSKTLIWMILGIILGGFIPGIILLIAYLKFDEVMRQQQPAVQAPPPPPQY